MSAESDRAAVGRANEAFYRAFEAQDLAAMEKIWVTRDYAALVHPAQPLVRGWPDVRATLAALFAGSGRIRFVLTDVQVNVRGEAAWVILTEKVHHEDDALVAVQATNVFERIGRAWKLVVHHASPISDEAGEPNTDFLQ